MISVVFGYLQGLIHFPDLVESFILPLPPKLTINEHQPVALAMPLKGFGAQEAGATQGV
jgi:hypothetical protein